MNPEDREEVWEGRANRAADSFTEHPLRWAWKIVFVVIALSLVLGVIGFFGSWWSASVDTVRPANARLQTTEVLKEFEALNVAAANVCDVVAANANPSASDPTLIEDPALAYKATYRNIAAEYDRRMENFFEAANVRNLPIPNGIGKLPRRAPTLKEALADC